VQNVTTRADQAPRRASRQEMRGRAAVIALLEDGQQRLGRRGYRKLVEESTHDRHTETRWTAAWALCELGESHPRWAVSLLAEMITARNSVSRDLDVRMAAACAMGSIATQHPRPVLNAVRTLACHHNDDVLIAVACGVLEHLLEDHWELCRPVVERWLAGRDRRPKWCLLHCYLPGRIEGEILRRLANDPDAVVRRRAAPALARWETKARRKKGPVQ